MLGLSSPAFGSNSSIPAKYTCNGSGTNPPLQITGVPSSATSLALIVYDPDVPKSIKPDGQYFHWGLWNLSPVTALIEESRGGGISEGGGAGYIPPCPPNGEHRYVFQLFALDKSLGETIASEGDLRQAMRGHVIEQTELVGRYRSLTSTALSFLLPAIVVIALAALIYRFVAGRRQA